VELAGGAQPGAPVELLRIFIELSKEPNVTAPQSGVNIARQSQKGASWLWPALQGLRQPNTKMNTFAPHTFGVCQQAKRRCDTRIPCALRVNCLSLDGKSRPALAVNLGPFGVRLVSFLPKSPESLYAIQLVGPRGFAVSVPATLTYAHGDEESWIMDCSFKRMLSEPELSALTRSPRRRVRGLRIASLAARHIEACRRSRSDHSPRSRYSQAQ
jgi:hypothetical protein